MFITIIIIRQCTNITKHKKKNSNHNSSSHTLWNRSRASLFAMKRSCGNSGTWEEVRLPVSTMLYSPAWPICDDSVDEDEQEFHLCAACIRRASPEMEDRRACRIVQSKLEKSLRLLKAPGARAVTHRCERCDSGDSPQPSASSASREELLEAAAARGLDGVLFPAGALALLAPRLAVVDDDKQEGVMQQLISDMFTKMSLKA